MLFLNLRGWQIFYMCYNRTYIEKGGGYHAGQKLSRGSGRSLNPLIQTKAPSTVSSSLIKGSHHRCTDI